LTRALLFGFSIIVNPTISVTAVHSLTVAVVRAGGILQREAGRLFRPHGITAAHFNVINLLADSPAGMRPTQITELMVVDPSSTTYLLDQLESRGWAVRKRDPADRRALKVVLTQAGKAIHRQVMVTYEEAMRTMAAAITRCEMENALPILEKLPVLAVETVDSLASVATPAAAGKRANRRQQ